MDMTGKYRKAGFWGIAGACAAFAAVAIGLFSARGAEGEPNYTNTQEGKEGVTLILEALKDEYFDQNRIEVHFKVRVRKDLPDGSAEVRLRNMDTGQQVHKTFPITYTQGEHFHWAAWGGTGKGTSSNVSELDDMLLGELAVDDEVPDGFYIPQITLFAADGSVIAKLEYTPEELRHMSVTGEMGGKFARKLSRRTVDGKIDEIKAIYEKFLAAEEEAKAAGADVTVPHFFTLALKETLRQSKWRADSHQYDVILDNYSYITNEGPLVLQQLADYRDNPASAITAPPTPRPKNERFTIKDGYFWSGDNPVFMSGLAIFALWIDLDFVREMGYNVVHVGLGVDSVFPTSEEPTGEPRIGDYNAGTKSNLKEFLDECERLGIKADVGITSQGIPDWFFEKHPEARLDGYSVAGFIPYDIENPDALELLSRYYKIVMDDIAGHPAINTIWLANEPTMLNYGERAMEIFRTEMLAKYGDLDGINKAWGTSITNVTDISVRMGKSLSPQSDVDFWWFNLGRLTKHFQWMSDEIHKYDPKVVTNFKLNNLQMGWYCPPMNVDQERVSDIGQAIGMDSGTFPFAKPYYDWLKSLDPDRPVLNLEFKGGGIRAGLDMWKGALHGLAGIDFWCWHPKPMFSRAMTDTSNFHRQALQGYNIQRLMKEVMAFQKFPRAPFVVLYPDPVLPRAWNYFQVHTPTVNAMKFMGYAVDYVTETRLRDGRLDKYKYDFIVMPAANFIHDDTFQRVGDFVKNGGKAIVIGDMPDKDPMERPRDLGWLKAPDDATPLYPGVTNGVTFAYGKGRVWTMPTGDEKALQERLTAIAKQELPPQPVEMEDVEYRTIPWKNAKGEDVYLSYVINEWMDADQPLKPFKFNVEMERAVDLVTGKEVKFNEQIIMPKATVMMIEWTPKKK